MKFTIDKNYTFASKMQLVRDKIKDFKAYFTVNDLVRMFTETTNEYVSGDVIKCDIEAYQARAYSDDVSFQVDLIVDELIQFSRIHFYIHEENGVYSIYNDPLTTTRRVFK